MLCVDIGASKTLIAAFTEDGQIKHEVRLPTPKRYDRFLDEFAKTVKKEFASYGFRTAACSIPGLVDRKTGTGIDFGNLPWHRVPIKADLSKLLDVPVEVENDTKLAGLSEARELHDKYKKVLYLTLSTGIGSALVSDDHISKDLADSEAGQMIINFDGRLRRWEDFGSGRAFFKRYGKQASDVADPAVWRDFTPSVAQGLGQLLAVIQPDVVIIGGGLGAHFERFGHFLREELESRYKAKLVDIPPILKAKRPEEAVIYGCYELIKGRG